MKKQELKQLIEEQRLKIEELEKSLASSNNLKDIYSKNDKESKKELDELHGLLDTIPEILPRKDKIDGCEWNSIEYSPMTRLSSWLANIAYKKLIN